MFSGVFPVIADELVWENSYARLTVYPDTSTELFEQRQWCNLTWKKPDNTIDVAFRFGDYLKGGRIHYWTGETWKKVRMRIKEYRGQVYYYYKDFNVKQDQTYHFRLSYTTDIKSSGKWDFVAKLSSDNWKTAYATGRYMLLDPWWDNDWTFKKSITIDKDQIPSNLKNFPVLINITDADLQANVGREDGGDIAFVDATETTQYNHEIEYFNYRTGRLRAWVNITTLRSDVDTTLYMYYGNDGAGGPLNMSEPTGVWDSHYVCVHHFEGDSWDSLDDSTSYNRDISSMASFPSFNEDARFGRGVDFDGNNDYLRMSDSNHFSFMNGGVDNLSHIEFVVNIHDTGRKQGIVAKYPTGTDLREWYVLYTAENEIRYAYYDETQDAQINRDSTSINGNQNLWRYYTVAYNSTNPTSQETAFELFDNSQNISEESNTGAGYNIMRNKTGQVFVGARGTNTGYEYMDGVIEELRISKGIVRNTSWVTTTYNTMWNSTDGEFFTMGIEEQTGDVGSPLNFTAVTDKNDGTIDITWDIGVNATHTLVEYNTVYPWIRGAGTELYNDSDNSTTFSSGSCGVTYYFQGWSYNNSRNNWSGASNSSNISCPLYPSNVVTTSYPTALNFTWTTGTFGDSNLLLRKSGSYPSSPTDGTQMRNDSLEWYNDTTVSYGTHYYTLWCWNDTIKRWSSGYNIPIGSLRVSVYDENTSLPIPNWSIKISNQAGDDVYVAHNCNNILTIDNNDLPSGLCSILINATNYTARVYYLTISETSPFFLEAYLPEVNTTTNYYVIQVINEENNELQDVFVEICEYDNTSGTFNEVSSLYTDGYGQVGLYLIGGKHYKVNLTKDGYVTRTGIDYFPDPNYYGIYYPKIFKMYFETIEPPEYIGPSNFLFGGSRHSEVGELDTLFIWGKCLVTGMENFDVYVIGYNVSTGSYLAGNYVYTSVESFYRNISNCNKWDSFTIKVYYNHTSLKNQLRTFVVLGNTSRIGSGFDTFLPVIIGYNPFGWSNLLIWLLLLVGCYYTDGKYAGEIMVMLGGLFLFINAFIMETTLVTVAGGLIPTLFVVVGIVAMWGEQKKKKVGS